MTLKCSKPALVSVVHNTRSFCMIDLMFEEKFQICDLTAGRHKFQSAKNTPYFFQNEIKCAESF